VVISEQTGQKNSTVLFKFMADMLYVVRQSLVLYRHESDSNAAILLHCAYRELSIQQDQSVHVVTRNVTTVRGQPKSKTSYRTVTRSDKESEA
jgi:hypothetical protein